MGRKKSDARVVVQCAKGRIKQCCEEAGCECAYVKQEEGVVEESWKLYVFVTWGITGYF